MSTIPKAPPSEPTRYELEGLDTEIVYATTSVTGAPQLTYTHRGVSQCFSGGSIRVQHLEIGRVITVTLQAVPDLHTLTLSLLVPPVNLEGEASSICTQAIRAISATTIAGPRLVKGQVVRYEVVTLHGTARAATC